MSDKKVGMSFEPEVLGTAKDGSMVVKDANHYVMLNSASQGNIYYCPRENKYYASESAEAMTEERFKEQFVPYLRWDHDLFEEVTLKDGSVRKVSIYPPTPENIAEKRAELINAAVKRAETPDMKDIIQATLPRELRVNEKFESMLNNETPNERLVRRINRNL